MRVTRFRGQRHWMVTIPVAFVPAAVLVFGVAYLLGVGGNSPPPLALSRAGHLASSAATVQASELGGTWVIGSGSVAGYRVREQLASLPAPSDAVGRTSSITGQATATVSGDVITVSTARFDVDVSTLISDREMRDRRLHTTGLESDRFPQATFELSQPLRLPAKARSGAAVEAGATGRLTIHGVTRDETIPVKVQLAGPEIEVAGSISFPFGDFGMEPPTIGDFVGVEDNATMEFDLRLERRSQPSP